MTCIDIRAIAMRITAGVEGPVIRTIAQSNPDVSAFVIGAKAAGLPPMVLVADCESLSRSSSGMPASCAIHSITAWSKRHLPPSWGVDVSATWLCLNGSSSFQLLLIDPQGVVNWQQVRWPMEETGSLACLRRVFPIYADAFVSVLDGLSLPTPPPSVSSDS